MQKRITNDIIREPILQEFKELPEFFIGRGEVKGCSFRLVQRSCSAYIYEVLQPFCDKRYEVFKRKEDARFGKIAYPKASAFGIWAWSARTIEKAEKYFHQINVKAAEDRKKPNDDL